MAFPEEYEGIGIDEIAVIIWAGLESVREEFACPIDYQYALAWGVKIPGGAIGFVPDDEEPGVWWIDACSTRWTISPSSMRGILVLAGYLGAEIIATAIGPWPRQAQFWEHVGLQKIEDDVYSIRVREKSDDTCRDHSRRPFTFS